MSSAELETATFPRDGLTLLSPSAFVKAMFRESAGLLLTVAALTACNDVRDLLSSESDEKPATTATRGVEASPGATPSAAAPGTDPSALARAVARGEAAASAALANQKAPFDGKYSLEGLRLDPEQLQAIRRDPHRAAAQGGGEREVRVAFREAGVPREPAGRRRDQGQPVTRQGSERGPLRDGGAQADRGRCSLRRVQLCRGVPASRRCLQA